jgi:adenosylmethionine-8-amino-7-oxononanoate aminotransferase
MRNNGDILVTASALIMEQAQINTMIDLLDQAIVAAVKHFYLK